MQSTRQHVLDYLSQHGTATTRQLAQAFGMTSANLRHHLTILESRGLLATTGRQMKKGRGRPEKIYFLTPAAQPDNLKQLTEVLLDLTTGRAQEASLKSIALSLIGEPTSKSGSATQRLVTTVKQLTPMGYQPGWEARPNAPQVVLGRCPYAAIISEHPELCRMDAYMLEELLGSPVEQVTKLQPGPQGTSQCVFLQRK